MPQNFRAEELSRLYNKRARNVRVRVRVSVSGTKVPPAFRA